MSSPSRHGFTLLEVMVALAIVALALVAILNGQGATLVMARKARTLEVATLLGRDKMENLALEVEREGFTTEKEEDCEEGDFGEEGHSEIRWTACVVKLEININTSDMGAIAASMGGNDADLFGDDEGGGDMGALGALGLDPATLSMALEFLPLITDSLSEAIRRLELTLTWKELGLPEQSFRLILYVTDPSRLMMPGMPGMAGAGGIPGMSGLPGSSLGTATVPTGRPAGPSVGSVAPGRAVVPGSER